MTESGGATGVGAGTRMTDLADLLTGTVTFLFTDLEGSTKLLEAHPEAYRRAVRRHHDLLRGAVEGHGGVVFETVGDAVYAAFAAPTAAVGAALAGQRALRGADWGEVGELRVRMAVHLGEVERQGAHYFGAPLYRCARLLATAHGGQVVLSEAAAAPVRDALPAGGALRDLGEHRLKDLARPERVAQLLHPALPADFPPLRSLDGLPNNLPLQLTSFIGREREVAALTELLGRARLVTVTGTGGAGKTRLALEVAAALLAASPDGAWFVDLAPLADERLVPHAALAALGLKEVAGRAPLEVLTEHLRPRTALLVPDNCEHLLDGCARLADAVLHACPHVRILATSRELLGLSGEVAWRVPSLGLPPDDGPPAGGAGAVGGSSAVAEAVAESDAVRLLVDRARLVQPTFAVTALNAAAVARVCRRLDGIPLAIELAAARVRALSVQEVAERLDDRFRLLAGGSRTALRRQQTLAAAVAWSHDLLTAPERRLFDRLSVFSGGCALEAAERVGAAEGEAEADVLDLLGRLVDKSLVLAEEGRGGTTRYRLLETLRQYGGERLVASGQVAAARGRHAAYYLALAERASAEMAESPAASVGAWLGRLEPEVENLRAALRWSVERGQAERALRVCGALTAFWYRRDRPAEGRALVEELLAAPAAGARTAARGRALVCAAQLAWNQEDLAAARAHGREAAGILREAGDREGEASAWRMLGHAAVAQGDHAAARAEAEQGLAVLGGTGSVFLAAGLRHVLAQACYYQGEYPAAQAHLETALRIDGVSTRTAGDLDWLGHVALARGDPAAARARYAESLERRRQLPPAALGFAFTLCGLVLLAAANGEHRRAARLAGAAAAICERSGVRPERTQEAGFGERLSAARAALGEEAFAAAWAAGQVMTLEQAVAYALEDPPAAA
jgi:predicted ATPase/class 3 adenylate cyclase